MPKVKINNSQGLVQESGSGLEIASGTTFAGSNIHTPVVRETIDLGSAGDIGSVHHVSNSIGGATTVNLPASANHPGQIFTFISTSTGAHILSASNETGADGATAAGAFITYQGPGVDAGVGTGQKLTFPSVTGGGASVSFLCTGKKYMHLTSTGSFTLAP